MVWRFTQRLKNLPDVVVWFCGTFRSKRWFLHPRRHSSCLDFRRIVATFGSDHFTDFQLCSHRHRAFSYIYYRAASTIPNSALFHHPTVYKENQTALKNVPGYIPSLCFCLGGSSVYDTHRSCYVAQAFTAPI